MSAFTQPCLLVLFWLLAGLGSAVGPPKQIGPHQARQVAKVGQSKKKLPCPVSADPPPIFIQWHKDGEPVSDVWTRFRVNDKDGSLRIKDVELEDAGKYVCKATNGFGSIMVNYSLIVVDKESGIVKMDNNNLFTEVDGEDLTKEGVLPHFMEEQKMLRNSAVVRPVGSSVRLRCRADGNPRPHVRWVKDGQITLESTEDEQDSDKRKWTLKLRNLQEEDSGNYVCFVTNRLGSINFTYTLEVIGKMKTKPMLVGPHPENETVQLGDVASFQCKVKSVVTPHIQWLKRLDSHSGEILNNSAIIEVKEQKFSVLKTGDVWKDSDGFYLNKLIIRNIMPSDAGMYICLGANTMGYSFRSAFLTVRTEPEPAVKDEREKIKQYSIDNIKDVNININVPSPSPSEEGSSDSDTSDGSLPLMIAIPGGVAIIAVAIAIYILQRRICFKAAQSNSHRTTRFNPVPTQERENLPTPVHTNPHMLPSAPTSIRTGDKVTNNGSLDFYSDISSVSRCHHQQQHNNLQYGY